LYFKEFGAGVALPIWWLDYRMDKVGFEFQQRQWDLSILKNIQTPYEVHPASYSLYPGFIFRGWISRNV